MSHPAFRGIRFPEGPILYQYCSVNVCINIFTISIFSIAVTTVLLPVFTIKAYSSMRTKDSLIPLRLLSCAPFCNLSICSLERLIFLSISLLLACLENLSSRLPASFTFSFSKSPKLMLPDCSFQELFL